MKLTRGLSLDEIIKNAVAEVFTETLSRHVDKNESEMSEKELQKMQAEKSADFKDAHQTGKTDKKEQETAKTGGVNPDPKGPGRQNKDIADEADKDSLNPKSMMAQLEKMDDENKPNISKEKMQVVFPSKEQVIRADVKHVLMMLNMMRSGKSLKKSDTKRQLQDYYATLNAGEKQALFATISGLTQILAAGVPGKSAVDPSYISLGISPKSPDEKKPAKKADDGDLEAASHAPADGIFKVAAPNKTTKSTSVTAPTKKKSEDDTPIVVGEVANKDAIKRVYESLRRG